MPIPSSIISIIAAGVSSMSIGTGYNFNYGPVDVFVPALRIYPQVYLEFQNENTGSIQMAGKITEIVPLTFRTIVAAGMGYADEEVEKVLEDLKRLMESLLPSLQAVGMLYSDFSSCTWSPRLVKAYPAELKTIFNLTYRQSRANPAST